MFCRRAFAILGIAASAPFLTAQGLVPLAGQAGTLEEPEETVSQARVVFEGIVFRDGAPVESAVVVSSAGGKAVTEQNGRYRLEAEVPADARSVWITAVGTAGQVATTTVELLAERQLAWVPPLELAQGTACLPSWLPTFGSVQGIDDIVEALVVFDDGSGPALYFAGSFDEAGGIGIGSIAKWDGSSWSSVGGGINGSVSTLTVFDDGSGPALYAAGQFSTAGSVQAINIAKWDGSTWAPLGSGLGHYTLALAVFDDGNGPALYAGGNFTTAGGVAADHIARWDGSSWSPLGAGVLGTVNALEVYDDGGGPALYAAGLFGKAGGILANRIAKWDGSTWSPLGAGLSSTVQTLAVFDDGGGPALYAGGAFIRAGGNPANNVAKWDGSSWSALGSGMAGISDSVDALTVFDDGNGPALYAGGIFVTAGGVAASHIAKWDGSSWSPLGSGMSASFSPFGYVGALAVFDDGSGPALFAGGDFDTAGSAGARNVAKWQRSSWSALGKGLTPAVLALTVFDDGRGPALYAGGTFVQAGGASKIARWDGSGWEPLGSGVDRTVYALVVFDDGSGPALYAGGEFEHAGGLNAKFVAKWDGSSWSKLGNLLGGSVRALTVFDDGTGPALYSGGFTQVGPGVAKWNGSSWKAVGGGIHTTSNSYVYDMEVYDDGTGPALYAGGDFLFAGGNMLLKWDGSSWSPLSSGLSAGSYANAHVAALAVFDDGSGPALYAAGLFGGAGGVSVSHIARWDGSSWSSLGSGIFGYVKALTVLDNGCGAMLFVGGSFAKAGSIVARDIASWDGSSWAPLGDGVSGSVSALTAFNDRTGLALYAGGAFQASSGDSNLAKWGSPDTTAPLITCPASIVVDDRPEILGETLIFLVTAEDEEDPTPSLVCSPPSGSHFPRGTTLVVCTATDAAGNQASCQFTVTVGAKVPEVLSSSPQARR